VLELRLLRVSGELAFSHAACSLLGVGSYSEELCFVLSMMLQKDAAHRPSATTILSLPTFRSVLLLPL